MKLKLDKILKNKIVLYLTFFLALVTIFGYLVKQNYQAILFFTLVLFLTKYFSNNMIVILGVSIIATNFLDLFRVFSSAHLEGLENKEKQPSQKVIAVLNHIATKYFNDVVTLEELDSKNFKIVGEKSLKKMKMTKAEVIQDYENIRKEADKLTYSDIKYLTDLANFWKSNYKLFLDTTDNKDLIEKANMAIYAIDLGIEILNTALEKKLNDDDKEETVKNLDSEFKLKKSVDTPPACANDEKYDEKIKK